MIPLSEAQIGKYRVVSIIGGFGLQRRLEILGLRIGSIIEVMTMHPIGGPIILNINGRQVAIGRGMASKIFVEPAEK